MTGGRGQPIEPMPRITRDANDIYMLYTGGTTGMPKGVMYDMGEITRSFSHAGLHGRLHGSRAAHRRRRDRPR
jgi:long-subunit acyl-CoA synthetase (AMP-forming)